MYKYEISGYYFSNDERKPFNEIVEAQDNIQAMQKVIAEIALNESIEDRTFKLDVIHYECL
jgi:hypothetical protein